MRSRLRPWWLALTLVVAACAGDVAVEEVVVAQPEACLEHDMKGTCRTARGCSLVNGAQCRARCGDSILCPEGYVCSSEGRSCEQLECGDGGDIGPDPPPLDVCMKVEVADPETCLELDMQPICQFTAGCAAVLLEPSCRATCGTLRICPQGYVCSSQPLQCELPDCNPETAPQDEVCVTESEL